MVDPPNVQTFTEFDWLQLLGLIVLRKKPPIPASLLM
jgi:hypothetical protein